MSYRDNSQKRSSSRGPRGKGKDTHAKALGPIHETAGIASSAGAAPLAAAPTGAALNPSPNTLNLALSSPLSPARPAPSWPGDPNAGPLGPSPAPSPIPDPAPGAAPTRFPAAHDPINPLNPALPGPAVSLPAVAIIALPANLPALNSTGPTATKAPGVLARAAGRAYQFFRPVTRRGRVMYWCAVLGTAAGVALAAHEIVIKPRREAREALHAAAVREQEASAAEAERLQKEREAAAREEDRLRHEAAARAHGPKLQTAPLNSRAVKGHITLNLRSPDHRPVKAYQVRPIGLCNPDGTPMCATTDNWGTCRLTEETVNFAADIYDASGNLVGTIDLNTFQDMLVFLT